MPPEPDTASVLAVNQDNLPVLNKDCEITKNEVFKQIRSKIPVWLFVPTIILVLALLGIVWNNTSANGEKIQDIRVDVGKIETKIEGEFKHHGEKIQAIRAAQQQGFDKLEQKLDKLSDKIQ